MKGAVLVWLVFLSFLAGGCGVNESDDRQAVAERDALKEQLVKLRGENQSLKDKSFLLENEKKTLTERVAKLEAEIQRAQRPAQSMPGPKQERAEAGERSYVVKKGDNLWNISRETGVPVETLKDLNKLQDSRLQVGQKLRLAP